MTMTNMQMLPIVADLVMSRRTADGGRMREIMGRLPPKDTIPYIGILESAAVVYADLMPMVRRIQELEPKEAELLAGMEEIKKASAVKWGPKKTASGETQESLRKKLEVIQTELNDLEEKAKVLDERIEPLMDLLKMVDLNNRNKVEVADWLARDKKGPIPTCIVEQSRADAEEFLASSIVLRFPSAYCKSVMKAKMTA